MTELSPQAPPLDVDGDVDPAAPWCHADAAVLASAFFVVTVLAHGRGGRDAPLLSVAALLVLAALVLTRAWTRTRPSVVLAAAGVAVSTGLVLATTAPGWSGAGTAASYVVTAGLVVLLQGWATDRLRRQALLGAVALLGGFQVGAGWLAWWGGEDPTVPFIGTFYWHNQSGIALALGSLAGLALILFGDRPFTTAGWVAAPLCGAFTVYSTSRGSVLALAVGWVLLMVVAATAGRPWRRLARGTGALVLLVGVLFAVPGPPFFAQWVSPFGGAQARSSAEPLTGNSSFRLDVWGQGAQVALNHPFTGAGFGGFAQAARDLDQSPRSPLVHNGPLQILTDGGLLLGLTSAALVLAVAAPLVLGLWRRRLDDRPGQLAGLTLLVVAGAHSAIDFDWSYPALMLVVPLLAAVAAPATSERDTASTPTRVAAVLLVATLGVAAVGALHGVPAVLAPELGPN